MLIYVLLVAGAVICAAQAMRSPRLLESALWLAAVSALTSLIMYRLGAEQIAVIELSVGAGLVTVLFVFAISIAGNDAITLRALVPRPLSLGLLGVLGLLLLGMILPLDESEAAPVEFAFSSVLWGDRALDVLLQMVVIFCGVLCLLGILQERPQTESIQAGQHPAEITELEPTAAQPPPAGESIAQPPNQRLEMPQVEVEA